MAAPTGITQIRFYNDNNIKNTPYSYHLSFCDSTSFSKYAPIKFLSIQTIPGTKFYLNKNLSPIIVGASGIYELDLRGTAARLVNFRFDRTSMDIINNSDRGYLIIDLIHEGGIS